MNNINFLKAYSYYSRILKRRYICRIGYERIQNLYRTAKEYGFTDEQREKFFIFIRSHNKEVHSRIREINKRLSHSEEAIYCDFDESELGAYAGRYCVGYERLMRYEEENNLMDQKELLQHLIITFKGEVIKRDPIRRIPLIETLRKWQKNVELDILLDDIDYGYDAKIENTGNIIKSLGEECLNPFSEVGSPDDLP